MPEQDNYCLECEDIYCGENAQFVEIVLIVMNVKFHMMKIGAQVAATNLNL